MDQPSVGARGLVRRLWRAERHLDAIRGDTHSALAADQHARFVCAVYRAEAAIIDAIHVLDPDGHISPYPGASAHPPV